MNLYSKIARNGVDNVRSRDTAHNGYCHWCVALDVCVKLGQTVRIRTSYYIISVQ